jgi:hypothetical protein
VRESDNDITYTTHLGVAAKRSEGKQQASSLRAAPSDLLLGEGRCDDASSVVFGFEGRWEDRVNKHTIDEA